MTGGRWALRTAGAVAVLLLLAACGGGPAGSGDGSPGAATLGPGGAGELGTLVGQGAASGASTSPSASSGGAATTTGPTTGPTSAPASSSPSSTSIAGLPAATAVRTSAVGGVVMFMTPSKNIGCVTDGTFVRCDIDKRSWNPPAKPADCELDYGSAIELGDGPAQFACVGDTALDPSAQPLPYNQALRIGNFVCVSTPAFLACRNTATTHGFSLSKEAFPPLY